MTLKYFRSLQMACRSLLHGRSLVQIQYLQYHVLFMTQLHYFPIRDLKNLLSYFDPKESSPRWMQSKIQRLLHLWSRYWKTKPCLLKKATLESSTRANLRWKLNFTEKRKQYQQVNVGCPIILWAYTVNTIKINDSCLCILKGSMSHSKGFKSFG